MIRSIRHKGLKRLYEEDDPRGVTREDAEKLRDILVRLDAAGAIGDMDLLGVPASLPQGCVEGILGGDGSGKLAGYLPFCGWRCPGR